MGNFWCTQPDCQRTTAGCPRCDKPQTDDFAADHTNERFLAQAVLDLLDENEKLRHPSSEWNWQQIVEKDAEIVKLRAAKEWRPIETAPKDGTEVDLWLTNNRGNDHRKPDCHWHAGEWIYYSGEPEIGYLPAEPDDWVATHFLPLPEPPETDQ